MWRHSGLDARPSAFSPRVKEEPSRRLSDLTIIPSPDAKLQGQSVQCESKTQSWPAQTKQDAYSQQCRCHQQVSDSLTVYYRDGPSHHDVIHWFANAGLEELDFVFTISAVLRFQVVGKLDRSRYAGLFGLCVCTHLCGLYQRWQ